MAEIEKKMKRIGTISITDSVIYDDGIAEVISYMKFVPLRVEYQYTGIFKITGLSYLFDENPIENVVPEYKVIIHTKEGKFLSASASRICNPATTVAPL